jgi:hypothetical protein
MEVEPPGYGSRVSGIWRYNLRDMEVGSKGYGAIVSGYGITFYGIWR